MNKKQSSATLTDLKNKIGEVLAVADQHGSVQITSYGRVKYEIRRVFGEEGAPSVKQAIKKRKSTKPESAAVIATQPTEPISIVEPMVEVAPQLATPVEPAVPTTPAPTTLNAMEALAAGLFGKREDKKPEPVVSPEPVVVSTPATQPEPQPAKPRWTPTAVMPGIQEWNRNSNKEQAWADRARKLVLNH